MASDENSLKALEDLLSEFFNAVTSNDRKREIEELLNNFSQTQDAWKHCLYFMSSTKNEYVMMYCMTVLEKLINRQWLSVAGEHKMEIRSTLNRFMLASHPMYILKKLAKLVVDIGRTDWPHFYPDFFSNILQLVHSQDTVMLGVVLLHTTSEELACLEKTSAYILEGVLEKHRHLVAATPPPSPTHGESVSKKQSLQIFSSSPLQSDSLLSNIFKSPGMLIQLEALPPLDKDAHQLCVLTLNCLSHYFSWIPLSATITPSLLSTIFHYAGFGCEARSCGNFSVNTNCLGVLAMNCINELLAKNCVPHEFEDFLLQMFQRTFYLLQKMTKDSNTNATGNRLADLEEIYIEKFTDFLQLFVSIHLRRFESNANFPVIEFLALLFKYTFRQPTHEGFFHCLDIWDVFLDYLLVKLNERSADASAVISRYREALMSLVTNILQKIMFRFNQSQLEELDDETLDDDSETEWQHFLRQCLEVIAKVAEIVTAEIFQHLFTPFNENLEIYFGVEQFTSEIEGKRHLATTGENECRRLHCTLRDLSTLFQAVGRLAEHFIGEHFPERFSDGRVLLERLVQTTVYGARTKLYLVTSIAQTVLPVDFTEVHAQSIATIKAFSPWLAQFYVESERTNQEKEKFATLMSSLIDSVVPLFSKEVPDKIIHSAAHLILSITTTIRPAFLIQLPSFQALYAKASQGDFSQLQQEVQVLLYRSLSLYLVLPWPNIPDSEQDWVNRAANHSTFVKQLSSQITQLKDAKLLADNKSLQEQAMPVIKRTLQIFEDWIENIAGEVIKSKQIFYQSLQDVIQTALAVFPVYIKHPDVIENIMSFFLALFQGLRVQMGVPFTEQTIRTFMNLFSREQLADIIHHESTAAHRVVEKFLKILELTVQEPGSAFKSFIPSIISISMDHIYPIIATRQSPDMKQSLYHLLHELVMNNWRYFFKGNVLMKLNCERESMENTEQFNSIMQAYGQSFLQPDITVFKQNLESLESLNTKWKLYSKQSFHEYMLFQFLNVLIQVLVHKSHDLLQEEIVVSVYNMASVDFDKFYADFLPQFLSGSEGLDDSQKNTLGQNFKIEKDLPSFTQSVHRFVNDLRYYRLINSSLPAGSVTL
ncbi:hypothetical protein ScPMuIL_003975 [Solemya velum]